MGLFWDLIQQSQISKQHDRTRSIESRVVYLEQELEKMQGLMHQLLQKLEEKFGEE